MDSHDNLYSFCDLALKHVLFIGIHDFDALVLLEKLLFSQFSLESTFFHQKGQTWILIVICIIFVIGHNKHVIFIEIHGFDAFALDEELYFHHFPQNQSSSTKWNELGFS